MDDLNELLANAEALPGAIAATALECGDSLELRLRLSLQWAQARKLLLGLRALVGAPRPAGPPVLRLVK